jgi:hypothetical protein
MGLTDLAENAVRNVLALLEGAGRDVERHTPLEEHIKESTGALHRTADSLERQIEVLEKLVDSLPALTDAVVGLSGQLTELMALAAPIEAVEHDASRLGHLLHRHHEPDATAPGE